MMKVILAATSRRLFLKNAAVTAIASISTR
ncbi:twin-arginine translocation signal domain-containing protein [Nonlabens ponticola]|uniref:Twin-arginine translocation signal domain-containing protein n=1 Tax=Nonlabens ponticola TaxID=2496866 RepID=A0A3S9MVE1_9FLAO|nr:twin-arginine translocation signal domain-containing protein [Nonlabens ponticola]